MTDNKKKEEDMEEIKEEGSELEKIKQERDEYLNGWKRAKADLINYQKDEAKRWEEMASYGAERLIRDLILVLDSFELGIQYLGSASAAGEINNGIYIIKNQLEEVLKKQGLEKIKVSPGDAFNPNLHESLGETLVGDVAPAVGQGSVSGEKPFLPGTIAAEVESGYQLNGKVIRPVRVKIFK